MSVGTDISHEEEVSLAAAPAKRHQQPGDDATASPTSKTENAYPDAKTDSTAESQMQAPAQSTFSLLSSLWSPLSSLLQSSKPAPTISPVSPELSSGTTSTTKQNKNMDNDTIPKTSTSTSSSSVSDQTTPSNNTTTPQTPTPSPPNKQDPSHSSPEAYFTPAEVPLFKTLQKKRLSGTRTKQLLRAASRAYNDPPPPPDLGTCCGSSCDPCVNDLWREERDVWRERWGDRRVEV